LVTDDCWSDTKALTARVQLLGEELLRERQRVRLHLGTAEVMARVHLLDRDWIQLRLETPIVARVHDRFVLRSYSPVHTMGGGVVAELGARKRLSPEQATLLATLLDALPADRMRAASLLAGEQGIPLALLPLHAAVAPPEMKAWQKALPDDVVMVNDTIFPRAALEAAHAALRTRVTAFHRAQPLAGGMERAELLGGLPPLLAQAALQAAISAGDLVVQGSLVAGRGFRAEFSDKQLELRDKIVSQLRAHGIAPPSVRELSAQLGHKDVLAVLRLLETRGEVVCVTPDLFVEAGAFAQAVEAVRRLPSGTLTAADFKAALPVSRKYLIPLLECLDRLGVTRRVGDLRRVESRPEPQTASTATA
jgi:selenocysteine-specific elongation factor